MSSGTIAASDRIAQQEPFLETRPLNVLTLTPFYPSQENPAQGCFIAEPLQEMKTRGVNNEVIAIQPFYRRRAHLISSEISSSWRKYFSMPGNLGLPVSGKFAAASLIRHVHRMHRQRPFHLIHAHSALPCGAAAFSISKELSIPFVVTVHGLDAFSTRQVGPILGRWCERITKRVYESASTVICISEKVRQEVLKVANAQTMIVYNGVDTSLFFAGDEKDSPLTILSVGNLLPAKGHAVLLRAFARVWGGVPDCVVEIIGDGPQRGNLVRLAGKLGVSERVRFLGCRSRTEVAEAMRRCAVFALPSTYEGLGCVYLEAMASAKPAIGCHGQGIDEIIEHGRNGLLTSPESESELSDALRMLLSRKQVRHRVGAAAYKTIITKHSLVHQASQLMEAYRECMQ